MRLPSAGEQFQSKYVIHERLGDGGFASVFRATDCEIQRDVAIKILAPQDGEYPPGVVARFMVEARVIARLRDPHTIRLFEFGESSEGLLFMVFQYVAGLDLAHLLSRQGALHPETAVHITLQVLGALAEAHQLDVLHRDIKPANILVHEYMGDPYAVKLLDFGIAKIDAAAGGVGLTKTGSRLGTPRYMAPEQVFGEPLSARSDIYSLGLVLFEMVVGHAAVQGDQKQILQQQLSDTVLRVPAHIGWPTLRAVIERMTSRAPGDRFATAADVVAALNEALNRREIPSSISDAYAVAQPRTGSSGHRVALQPTHDPRSGSSGHHVALQPGQEPRSGSSGHRVALQPTRETAPSGRWVLVGGVALCLIIGAAALWMMRDRPPQDAPRAAARPSAPPTALLKTASTPDLGRATVVNDAGADVSPIDAADLPTIAAEGCGTPHEDLEERWLDLRFADRRVRVYLPRRYDPNRRYPLIVALQTKYVSTTAFVKDAKLHKLPFTKPVIVIAPTPSNRVNPWDEAIDPEVVQRAIRSALRHFCVNPAKISVFAHHDGARFARELACELPFSAMALTGWAERPENNRCEISDPFPTLWAVGRKDTFIPVDGGPGCTDGPYLTHSGHDAVWKLRNECGEPERTWRRKGASQCQAWDCEVPYVSCRADGGHHLDKSDWTIMYPVCSPALLEFDVAGTAYDFFREFGRDLTPAQQRKLVEFD